MDWSLICRPTSRVSTWDLSVHSDSGTLYQHDSESRLSAPPAGRGEIDLLHHHLQERAQLDNEDAIPLLQLSDDEEHGVQG